MSFKGLDTLARLSQGRQVLRLHVCFPAHQTPSEGSQL